MAATPARAEAVEFNKIIQAARQRKKNESLAAQIFGRKPSDTKTLASRSGIHKKPQSRRPFTSRSLLGNSKASFTSSTITQTNAIHSAGMVSSHDSGFAVRGMGTFVVVAQNFAPGTTAADIEAVLGSGKEHSVTSCRLVASRPTVIAEITFSSREAAQAVVSRFNNKMADGRLLHVYLQIQNVAQLPRQSDDSYQDPIPASSRPPTQTVTNGQTRGATDLFDRRRQPQYGNQGFSQDNTSLQSNGISHSESRQMRPQYEDGKFGFSNYNAHPRNDADVRPLGPSRGYSSRGGLVSDGMMREQYPQGPRDFRRY